ncbi:uncharacterized protein MONOS_15531 [Monocercomonoides exilis]|uniref:uncharacterized protein n=1 Tax=Monocercomonoides exilis TaxID=2049356 RepID=UPI003559F263|nr:hypothetical protein MONOS_15531 [Monocercomonoides exilis]|eukprot:MONOS_15531.1-p1 / transcript=MONOS_15531.1 / gene=MONOS_15531 / organism=Monocercomonoides_exilis_PA203 / gene_product=unspecified product / transcript_product=unspecified product / location=Mono_scaffold01264:6081-7317(-) / protein_length=341 / sequence_SO=supercontig / SO=protein_coding / is_pseudo=false
MEKKEKEDAENDREELLEEEKENSKKKRSKLEDEQKKALEQVEKKKEEFVSYQKNKKIERSESNFKSGVKQRKVWMKENVESPLIKEKMKFQKTLSFSKEQQKEKMKKRVVFQKNENILSKSEVKMRRRFWMFDLRIDSAFALAPLQKNLLLDEYLEKSKEYLQTQQISIEDSSSSSSSSSSSVLQDIQCSLHFYLPSLLHHWVGCAETCRRRSTTEDNVLLLPVDGWCIEKLVCYEEEGILDCKQKYPQELRLAEKGIKGLEVREDEIWARRMREKEEEKLTDSVQKNGDKTPRDKLYSDVCKGGQSLEEGGAADPEDVVDGRGDVVYDCGEEGAGDSG